MKQKLKGYHQNIPGFPTFDDMLKMHAEAFDHWRYFHEVGIGSFNFQFCEALAQSIVEVVNSMLAKLEATVIKQQADGKIVLPPAGAPGTPAPQINIPPVPVTKRLARAFRYAYWGFRDGFRDR